jgi:hypothetical protein
MRYLSKGGIWKNTEDEILKAAVLTHAGAIVHPAFKPQ